MCGIFPKKPLQLEGCRSHRNDVEVGSICVADEGGVVVSRDYDFYLADDDARKSKTPFRASGKSASPNGMP